VKLPLAEISRDGIQLRVGINAETVKDYMENFDSLPPITVFHITDDSEQFVLVDGFHRVAAAELLGLEEIEAEVKEGSYRDALIYACGANASHGLRRTREDKENTVLVILQDEELKMYSDNMIAKIARVSQPFVSSLRRTVGGEGVRIGVNGKVYHYGKSRDRTEILKIGVTFEEKRKLISYGLKMNTSYKEVVRKLVKDFIEKL
jgi:hypothetical protein